MDLTTKRHNQPSENIRPRASFRGSNGYGVITRVTSGRSNSVNAALAKRDPSTIGLYEGPRP